MAAPPEPTRNDEHNPGAPGPSPATARGALPVEDAQGRRPRRWHVGTLTYSAAGLAVLFAWLLCGDFAWQMKERAVTPVAQLAMRQLKASDFLVGLVVVSVPSALTMIFGPVVGTWSDRHRGRWGRRIPYLLVPTPVVVVSIVAMAFAPQMGQALHGLLGARSPGEVRCALFVFCFFWTISEAAAITAEFLLYGLINDVVPRSLVGRFFGLFRVVSLFAGIIFNLRVIGYAEEHTGIVFIGLAVLYGVGFSLMCLMVKEGEYPPPPPDSLTQTRRTGDVIAAMVAYCRQSFADPHYLWIYIGTMFAAVSFGAVNSFSVFYAKSIGLGLVRYGEYQALTYMISLVLAYPLGALSDRIHPLRVGIAVMGMYAAVTLWGGMFATTPQTFAIAFISHGVASGAFYTVQIPIFQRLFPQGKFGQHLSAAKLLERLGFVILPPAVGLLLDATGNEYRYTFASAGVIAVVAFLSLLVVYRSVMRMGGTRGYIAPE
jgi:MFS family permease